VGVFREAGGAGLGEMQPADKDCSRRRLSRNLGASWLLQLLQCLEV
jgi:hypothetical protein